LSILIGLGIGVWVARTGLAQEWGEPRTLGPFVVRADFPLREIEPLLAQLSQLQTDLVETLPIPPPNEWIELYLFHDRASYGQFLARYFPRLAYRRAMYVKDQGPGMVLAQRTRDFEIDLRHECTHALLHAALAEVPLWLDEGLAVYFEVAAEKRAFDSPQMSRIRWSLFWGNTPPLDSLETKRDVSEMGRGEYRDSWAWVHFMLHGPPEARQVLVEYLADLHTANPGEPLSRRLRRRLPMAEASLAAHFKSWKR
jgi:hypothetical protein